MEVKKTMNNIIETIKHLIEYEKSKNPDIQYLNSSHAPLIAQIVSNYNLKQPSDNTYPHAKMIFLGAPTGAGKDTLVRKIVTDYPDENFVILNMDMFRPYHNEIINNNNYIADKDFAKETNQTSYELYYIIQELILQEFPGTSTIVTGTMRDLSWVKQIIKRYKYSKKTNYDISLVTLAVPTRESAISIFERYLKLVDERYISTPTPLRYTSLDYHNDTINKFATNIHLIEDDFHHNPADRLFNSIKVYRRHKDIFDLSEDTLIYDTAKPDPEKCAYAHTFSIMNSPVNMNPERIANLLEILERNKDYLKKQGLYESIYTDIKNIVTKSDKYHSDILK